jgi:hypothetical protein
MTTLQPTKRKPAAGEVEWGGRVTSEFARKKGGRLQGGPPFFFLSLRLSIGRLGSEGFWIRRGLRGGVRVAALLAHADLAP